MVLRVMLTSIFGEDYDNVASHFNILSERINARPAVRSTIRALGKIVVQSPIKGGDDDNVSKDILGCSWRREIGTLAKLCQIDNWSVRS